MNETKNSLKDNVMNLCIKMQGTSTDWVERFLVATNTLYGSEGLRIAAWIVL